MEEKTKNNKDLHRCKECGLHYKGKELAEKCENWCREHKTCNLEITKQAEEDKKEESESELEKCKRECEKYLNNWKRTEADFLNYKGGEAERIRELIEYEREAMILNLLQVADSIYLAEKHIPKHLEKEQWVKGFSQIIKQVEDLLKKEGVEEVKVAGNGFDPNVMEAIEEVEGEERGKVAEEVQKGYIMNGRVIRPAKVKISK